uniref:Globin family profile domain-containing protein n=1 Tax=Panagrolaimus sp. JU765 TaxID=591449 RepID=A0AC34Q688_9BILA
MYQEAFYSVSNWYEFDENETRIMKLSWSLVGSSRNEMEALGVRIYTMIFNQCPDARRLFPFMKFNGKEKNTTAFQFQALRFVQVLQSAINNLDNLTSLDSILDNLGRRHGKLESSSGFRKCYWTTFLECAIYHLRLTMEKPSKKKQQTMTPDEIDEAIVLWRILLRNVIDRIEIGYEKDIQNRLTSTDTPPTEYKKPPKLSEYSRSSSMTNKSESITEMMSSLNPFKTRKNSGDK